VPDVEIPKRALFKSTEVCEIASVQPYVLRSWESEFPDLGVSKGNGGPRFYRRTDVERVLRIKQLVFSDGLTLAGVRRRIEEEAPIRLEEMDVPPPPVKPAFNGRARDRLIEVRNGLQSILDMLSARPGEATVHRQASAPSRSASNGKAHARRPKPAIRSARKAGKRR